MPAWQNCPKFFFSRKIASTSVLFIKDCNAVYNVRGLRGLRGCRCKRCHHRALRPLPSRGWLLLETLILRFSGISRDRERQEVM